MNKTTFKAGDKLTIIDASGMAGVGFSNGDVVTYHSDHASGRGSINFTDKYGKVHTGWFRERFTLANTAPAPNTLANLSTAILRTIPFGTKLTVVEAAGITGLTNGDTVTLNGVDSYGGLNITTSMGIRLYGLFSHRFARIPVDTPNFIAHRPGFGTIGSNAPVTKAAAIKAAEDHLAKNPGLSEVFIYQRVAVVAAKQTTTTTVTDIAA